MTRAEFLERLQEGPQLVTSQAEAEKAGLYDADPANVLFEDPRVLLRLRLAHLAYCNEVARIFGMDDQILHSVAYVHEEEPIEIFVPAIDEPAVVRNNHPTTMELREVIGA